MRRVLPAAVFLFVLAIAWWFWPRATAPGSGRSQPPNTPVPGAAASVSNVRPPSAAAATARRSLEEDYPIAAPLNRADSTIVRDLQVLQNLFEAWRSNFPRDGNPVGENADITAALTGENRLGLALLPKDHPAITRGELCDRWGTPFRFHQLSGQQMEVRSAGPDRKFATDDDALWTPP